MEPRTCQKIYETKEKKTMIKPSKVIFVDKKLEEIYFNLNDADPLKKAIKKAIEKIKQNAFSGESIPKRIIPKEYFKKYKIDNLWLMDLSKSARLIYSITTPNEVEILSIIIDFFEDHKKYERKFKY